MLTTGEDFVVLQKTPKEDLRVNGKKFMKNKTKNENQLYL